ncbi:hypothetical protein CSUB01_12549 [Colletotrichum sublineola]|uniref:NACHT domain-containing protein n=1 Tax=Colletotrichum sublineola TaxID=1173701 RepID=A0A066XP53_COLSU|nr:hypothetical protein CSUB01_12549 [Colletotrichum sublineola]
MKTFFQSLVSRILKRQGILIFIDAIDECGEDLALQLIEYLKQLLADFPLGDFGVNVCFSCRDDLTIGLDGVPTIVLDMENKADIDMYVQGRLPSTQDFDLRRLVSSQAQGEFTRASIAVQQVLRMKRRGHSAAKIKRETERILQPVDHH